MTKMIKSGSGALSAQPLSQEQNPVVHAALGRHFAKAASDRLSSSSLSLFLLAVACFLALNVFLITSNSIHFDPFKYPKTNWIWWLIKDIRNTKAHYNIATIGSSLVVSALCNCDAGYLGKDIDPALHHSANYFDNQASMIFGCQYKTINLATFGEMPSDAYLILRTTLKLGQHPDLLIYGLAPRDFLDSTLNSCRDTQPFHYLSRILDTDEMSFRSNLPLMDRLGNWLRNSFFLQRYALDLQMVIQAPFKQLLDNWLPRPQTSLPFTYLYRRHLLPVCDPEQVYADTRLMPRATFTPMQKWVRDNSEYYRLAYRNPNPSTLQDQMYYLGRLSKLCQEQNIQLILVNMPLSAKNISLLTKSRYQSFLSNITDFVRKNPVRFYDLNDPDIYQDQLFEDSVHLNALGGKQLLDTLLATFAQDPTLSKLFVAAGKKLEKNQALAEVNHASLQ